ncbi:MAG TPA: hypothetical protein VGR22_06980 [Thermomicrobiales bacterium]|nr:hypothetical protein [Thermomicrobiales bacterium]
MPTRLKSLPSIVIITIGLMLGLVASTFTAGAQVVATSTAGTTQPSVTQATPETTRAAATPEIDPLPLGTILVMTTEILILRAPPMTDAEALRTLPEGTQVQVISGPVQALGYTCYEVEFLDTDVSVSGWAATNADFADPIDALD